MVVLKRILTLLPSRPRLILLNQSLKLLRLKNEDVSLKRMLKLSNKTLSLLLPMQINQLYLLPTSLNLNRKLKSVKAEVAKNLNQFQMRQVKICR